MIEVDVRISSAARGSDGRSRRRVGTDERGDAMDENASQPPEPTVPPPEPDAEEGLFPRVSIGFQDDPEPGTEIEPDDPED